MGLHHRDNPTAAVDIVKFMLDCNPNVKLHKMERKSLLHFACNGVYKLLLCNAVTTKYGSA
eukprot:scaffold14302_cov141-Skeletonema_marinoi.AAC.1